MHFSQVLLRGDGTGWATVWSNLVHMLYASLVWWRFHWVAVRSVGLTQLGLRVDEPIQARLWLLLRREMERLHTPPWKFREAKVSEGAMTIPNHSKEQQPAAAESHFQPSGLVQQTSSRRYSVSSAHKYSRKAVLSKESACATTAFCRRSRL
jgi:hypothetical protein